MSEKTHWKQRVTRARLMELLRYELETGLFTWITDRRCIRAGSTAGTVNNNGYIAIKIDGVLYTGHRLAWLWVYGEFPDAEIDHINRDRSDNKISNLRPATSAQNKVNRGKNPRNTSGITGVSFSSARGKFVAQISHGAKNRNLGRFETLADAIRAREAAADRFHGEFQPTQEAA